jgi:hypothetical protein
LRFGPDTLVPISFVLSVVGAVWWISNTLAAMTLQQKEAWFAHERSMMTLTGRIDVLQSELRLVSLQVAESGGDRWRFVDMAGWAKLLAAQNPNLTIPQPSRGQ